MAEHTHDHDHDHGHHGGHSHGHAHGHGDDHAHGHGDGHAHGHGHDHAHDHSVEHGHGHGHSAEHGHGHGHSVEHGHGHGHSAEHGHGHGHSHGHSHGHGHGHGHHGHGDDFWDGAAYLARPGVKETAAINSTNLVSALTTLSKTHPRFAPENFPNLALIEVGCGTGAVTQHLAETFGSVYATELSKSMLTAFASQPVAQKPNVSFGLVGLGPHSAEEFRARKAFPAPTEGEPGRTAPPPAAAFDVAAVNLVLHHVDDVQGFMEGVRGVLKPGGVVVITEFTLAEDGTDVVARNRAKRAEQEHNAAAEAAGSVNAPGHLHDTFSLESIQRLLNHFGFTDVGAARGPMLPVFGPEDEAVPGMYAYGLAP